MKRAFTLLVIPAAAVSLAACGNAQSESTSVHPMITGATPTTPAAGDHNDQDVLFARQMIPHHQQAIQMADLAVSRATKPEVKQLAKKIKSTQESEIKEMDGWLRSWGVAATPTPNGEMHTGPQSPGPGMMPEQDMKKLQGLSGAQFDKTFLTMMIKHHEGAIAMAKTELAKGKYGAAKTLAGKIVATQAAEIITMNALVKKM